MALSLLVASSAAAAASSAGSAGWWCCNTGALNHVAGDTWWVASFRELSLSRSPPPKGPGTPAHLASCRWAPLIGASGANGTAPALWVVETGAGDDAPRAVAAAVASQRGAEQVWAHGRSVVVAVAGAGPPDELLALPAGTATVVAAPAVVRPPRDALARAVARRVNASKANPVIEAAVAQVSADHIQASVEELAAHFTRLSTAPDTLKVEAELAAKFIELGFEVATFPFRDGMSSNVVATLRGTKFPDTVVLAGAHYDSRSTRNTDPTQRAPGADDNGSGSAHILEMARVFSEAKVKFEYTVQLLLFSGEEQGLVGSRAYAASLADAGTEVVAMFNADMIGYSLPNTEYTAGMKDRYIADWLLAVANNLAQTYVPELRIGTSASCCSDHQSFTENGFPAIGYFENEGSASDNPHYHKSTDLPEYVDYQLCKLLSQACMATLMTFAVPDVTA